VGELSLHGRPFQHNSSSCLLLPRLEWVCEDLTARLLREFACAFVASGALLPCAGMQLLTTDPTCAVRSLLKCRQHSTAITVRQQRNQ
jgi:hypothetical protein